MLGKEIVERGDMIRKRIRLPDLPEPRTSSRFQYTVDLRQIPASVFVSDEHLQTVVIQCNIEALALHVWQFGDVPENETPVMFGGMASCLLKGRWRNIYPEISVPLPKEVFPDNAFAATKFSELPPAKPEASIVNRSKR